MSCDGAAFKVLTDKCIDFRARAEACELRLPILDGRAKELEQALRACEAPRPVSVTPTPPSASSLRPFATFALGALGTGAIAAGVAFPGGSDASRLGLGVAGALALAGGVVLAVLP